MTFAVHSCYINNWPIEIGSTDTRLPKFLFAFHNMAISSISCILSEIKKCWFKITIHLWPYLHSTPPLSLWSFAIACSKTRMIYHTRRCILVSYERSRRQTVRHRAIAAQAAIGYMRSVVRQKKNGIQHKGNTLATKMCAMQVGLLLNIFTVFGNISLSKEIKFV